MFGFLGELLTGMAIGLAIFIAFESIKGGGGGSGIIRRGSQKDKDIDARVRERLAKGSCSSREELQEWWDTYHPPK